MAMLHQEIDAVLFGSDGIGISFRDALHDLHVGNVEFVAAGGTLIGADFAFDDDARFLGEAFDGVKNFGWNGVFRDYALDDARAVAKLGEEELAAFAEIVEPSADGDGLAFVLADFCDGADGHKSKPLTAENAEYAEKQLARIPSSAALVQSLHHRGHGGTRGKPDHPRNSAFSVSSAVELRVFQFLKGCDYFFAGVLFFFSVDF